MDVAFSKELFRAGGLSRARDNRRLLTRLHTVRSFGPRVSAAAVLLKSSCWPFPPQTFSLEVIHRDFFVVWMHGSRGTCQQEPHTPQTPWHRSAGATLTPQNFISPRSTAPPPIPDPFALFLFQQLWPTCFTLHLLIRLSFWITCMPSPPPQPESNTPVLHSPRSLERNHHLPREWGAGACC